MKHNLLRTLAALLSMALLMASVPVYSEEAAAPTVEVIETSEIIAETPAPTPEPTAEPAPEPTAAPEPAPEITAEPTAAPSAAPSPEVSALPEASPAPEASAEPLPEESVMPEDGVMLLSVEDVSAEVERWIAELDENHFSSDYQRAFWLYRRMIAKVRPDNSSRADETAEAALLNGKAGSLGFARAFEGLLDAANIASVVVTEIGSRSEAWNVVRLDGKWAHIDVFSDALSGSTGERFGLTDGAMARFRSWDRSGVADSNSTSTCYYVREKDYIACTDPDDLFELLIDATEKRTKLLKLYWAGADKDLSGDFIERVLNVVSPFVDVTYEEDGCYCILALDHSKVPQATVKPSANPTFRPDPTATPKPTLSPSGDEPEKIVAEPSELVLGVGEEVQLGWRLVPDTAEAMLRFSSSAYKIVSVDDEGVITARRTGSAQITIETDNGLDCEIDVTVKSAPKKISSFVAESTELAVGERAATRFSFNAGAAGSVAYRSSDTSVATVDDDGVITAIAPGEAKITITSYNGISRSGVIRVNEGPKYILLSDEELTLAVGDSHRLSYELNEGAKGEISFASSDESIVSVSASGSLHALKGGVAVITASAGNGVSASCTVTVTSAPESVILSAPRDELGVGEEMQLDVRMEPAGATGKLKFASSSSKCISVNSSGVVTAKRSGSASIRVETDGGLSAIISLTVKKAPKSISLSTEKSALKVGESTQLSVSLPSGSAGGYVLTSSDESRLHIDASGLATALAPGEVTVTATAYNGVKKSGVISIIADVHQLVLSAQSVSIGAGDSWTLTYQFNEGASGKVSFASSDESIAAVSQKGEIRALKAGVAVITAETENGVKASCVVTVASAPSAVRLSAARGELGVGESLQLQAEIAPAGTVGSLSYASGNSKVLSVSEDGVVTGKRAGSAEITVKTYNGREAKLSLTVKDAPTKLNLSAERSVLGAGEEMQLAVSIPSGSAGSCAFQSSNEAVLCVDESGLVTAIAPGEATVTAATYNGIRKSLSIAVKEAPRSITLSGGAAIAIGAQDQWTLEYSLGENAAGAVSFSSSNPSVATIDAFGVIRALQAGTALIAVESYNGVRAQCSVQVVAAPKEVLLTAPRESLGVGEEMRLSASTLPDGALGTLEFSSSNSKVIAVNGEGVVLGRRSGSATITVKTYNGVTGSIRLSVKSAPKSISLSAERNVLGVGESMQLSAALPSGSAGGYCFISEDESILTIDENGVATAHAVGQTRIAAVAYNGVKKAGSITVLEAPASLTLSPETLLMGVQEKAQLSCVLSEGSAGEVCFTSEDESIASVDAETGAVVSHALGKTRILATAYNGVSAVAAVEVRPAPSYLRLPYESLEIGLGDTVQIIPEIDPDSAAVFEFAVASSRIAAVDAAGCVTGLRTGSTELRIRTGNGLELILPVKVKNAPREVSLVPEEMVLGVGESAQLEAAFNANAAGSVSYVVKDGRIASVDESGVITALAVGETSIGIETYNGVRGTGKLTVVAAPKKIKVSAPATMGVGQEAQLEASFQPEGSHSTARYEIIQGDCVQIDSEGRVSALKEGKAVIRASTHVQGVYTQFEISVKPAPTDIRFSAEEYDVLIDESFTLQPQLSPKDAAAQLSYAIERAGFFTIDENGVITPIMRGSTRVRVTTHNGLSTTVTINIIDPFFPEELSFVDTPPAYLEAGDSYTPIIGVYPESAVAALKWRSSDTDIATVDASTGVVVAQSHGSVTIEAVSERNPALMLSYKLVVLSPERCLTMPSRRTSTSKISTTLSQIKQVRSSAYRELEALYTRGKVSKSEYNARKSIVSRAFDMYLFPWMTLEEEPYWKEANSENGAKDFKPGIVYYGLPYTQTNRRHTVSSAISAGYFKDTGKGYYLMNNDKFVDRGYAGNDCSSFASMAVWGTGKAHSYDSTRDIATASVYKTISDWDELRPGDLLNKYNSHVVIFLYWANEAHTQMVIIEQGGGEAGTNCISTSIRKTTYYQNKGYSIRRVAG